MALTDTQFNTLTSILGGNKTDRVNGVSVTPGVPSVNTTINAGDLTKAIPKTFPTITTTPNRQVTLPPPTGVTLDANGVAIPSQAKTGDNSNLLQSIYDQISGGIDTLNTKGTAETQLQNELQLSQKREAATASYNKYNQAKVQLQQQLDQMRSAEANKVGGVGGGYSATIQDFERKGNANLANLAILAQIDQGNYNDAQQTIKEKLDAQFQPVQDNIDNLYKFAQLYGNDPEIQAAIQQKKTDLANVTKTADELHTLLLQNGAPQSVYTALDKVNNDYVAGKITAAEAQSKMYQAAGNYGVDPLQKAQLSNIYSEIAERNANAKAKTTQLPASVQTRVQSVANGWDNEAVVKQYNTIAETVDAVKNAGISPTDDIQRIYAFAKVMDPNSAVKEGEYKSIQEYSTALLNRVGLNAKRTFDPTTGALTQTARDFIDKTLANRLASSEKSYDNAFKEYGRRINKITGGNDGTEYITDYKRAFGDDLKKQLKTGEILVKDKEGNIGAIPEGEFDPSIYQKI